MKNASHNISTLNEKPLHAALKEWYASPGDRFEVPVDGYLVDIMPDLLECGVTILNPQDLCNGLDNIRRELKGRVCIDLDVDRQTVVPRGTPREVEDHIGRCIRELGSPQGGLMLKCGVYEGTPLANIEAVFRAMTRWRRLFAA